MDLTCELSSRSQDQAQRVLLLIGIDGVGVMTLWKWKELWEEWVAAQIQRKDTSFNNYSSIHAQYTHAKANDYVEGVRQM